MPSSSRPRSQSQTKIRAKVRPSRSQEPQPGTSSPQQSSAYHDLLPVQLSPRLAGLNAQTKAGVRGFPGVDAAQELLAQTMRKERVRGEVLDLTAMGGLFASLPGVTLRAVEGSAPALAVLRAAGLDVLAAVPGDLLTERWPQRANTTALILAGDRGNAYAQAQVAWAHANTPPGSTLYLAGDRDKGFDRYVRQAAQAFGTGETIARDGGMRVAKLVRRPGPTPPYPEAETFEAFGVRVVGLPGVFSAARPDKATALLLQELDIQGLDMRGQRVLDLGCGTGIIGAWAAARGAEVTLLDADLQSVRSAQATLAANNLKGVVLHSDAGADLTGQYDLILTNPPFHVGRGVVLDVAREFIAAAQRHLAPGGKLVVVANDPLPYETPLAAIGRVTERRREAGFKILEVSQSDSQSESGPAARSTP